MSNSGKKVFVPENDKQIKEWLATVKWLHFYKGNDKAEIERQAPPPGDKAA